MIVTQSFTGPILRLAAQIRAIAEGGGGAGLDYEPTYGPLGGPSLVGYSVPGQDVVYLEEEKPEVTYYMRRWLSTNGFPME